MNKPVFRTLIVPVVCTALAQDVIYTLDADFDLVCTIHGIHVST